ncbi:MAG: DNA-directed RNA polymerase subunit omega [Armatimonadetes bacterium]|nr:DNA-directed RNA polymerase subunit omega [Armatimonadota bacterium]
MSMSDGIRLPEADVLGNFPEGRYVLSNLAAKRARQLREGAPPLVRTDSNHPLTIALAEIAAGKIRPNLPAEDLAVVSMDSEVSILTDDTVPAELGMLLPGLEELEEDHEAEFHEDVEPDEEEEDAPSLSSILGDDAEAEVATPENDDTVSLNDLEDQEAQDEAEEETD